MTYQVTRTTTFKDGESVTIDEFMASLDSSVLADRFPDNTQTPTEVIAARRARFEAKPGFISATRTVSDTGETAIWLWESEAACHEDRPLPDSDYTLTAPFVFDERGDASSYLLFLYASQHLAAISFSFRTI